MTANSFSQFSPRPRRRGGGGECLVRLGVSSSICFASVQFWFFFCFFIFLSQRNFLWNKWSNPSEKIKTRSTSRLFLFSTFVLNVSIKCTLGIYLFVLETFLIFVFNFPIFQPNPTPCPILLHCLLH